MASCLAIAAKERLARLALLDMLDELDVKHGAPSAAVRTDVARDARRIFRRRSGGIVRSHERRVHVRNV
jgi:hypothetical protein